MEQKKPDLNDLWKLIYSDLDGILDVAIQEACSKYPKWDWKQIKLWIYQATINALAVKLVQHFQMHKRKDEYVDGDGILMDWTGAMRGALAVKNIPSVINQVLSEDEKEGETIH